MREDLTFRPQGSVLVGEKMEDSSRLRVKLCLCILLIGFAAVAAKLVYLQVLRHDFWVKHVNDQRRSSIEISPKRGTIYDRNDVTLATSVIQEILCVAPHRVEDLPSLARALSPWAGLSAGKIIRRVDSSGLYLVYLRRGFDLKTAQKIGAMNLKGVEFRSESKRHYPKGVLASNLIGFASMENKGLEGLEYKFDTQLAGEAGEQIIIKDSSQQEIVNLEQTIKHARNGNHVVLTIDEFIQYITEKALDGVIESYSPESAAAVVLDPRTGEVIATACRPTFDPNKPSTYKVKNLRNRVVIDTFEPGSTFKPIAATAVLEHRVITPEDRIYCELGAMRYHGHTFNDVHPLAEISFADVIAESSNIGMIKAASLLKPEQLYDCIKNFGFGEYTGIDLPGESAGIIRPPSRWSGLSMGSLPIGQEISVTVLQLASAFSAIANNGKLMRPYVVSKIISPDGETLEQTRPKIIRQVMRPDTAAKLTDMMERAVTYGTGTEASLKGYRVAGKTGTAQKPDLKSGGYLTGKYYSVFAGFVPADDPVACIVVMADSAQKKYYGGQVAAPAFREIAQQILNKLEIPPTLPEEQAPSGKPVSIARARVPARQACKKDPLAIDADGMLRMPDMTGMTMRGILKLLAGYPVYFEFKGSGIAWAQDPAPGTRVARGQRCHIAFRRLETQ